MTSKELVDKLECIRQQAIELNAWLVREVGHRRQTRQSSRKGKAQAIESRWGGAVEEGWTEVELSWTWWVEEAHHMLQRWIGMETKDTFIASKYSSTETPCEKAEQQLLEIIEYSVHAQSLVTNGRAEPWLKSVSKVITQIVNYVTNAMAISRLYSLTS